jgi:hypothetical protein
MSSTITEPVFSAGASSHPSESVDTAALADDKRPVAELEAGVKGLSRVAAP